MGWGEHGEHESAGVWSFTYEIEKHEATSRTATACRCKATLRVMDCRNTAVCLLRLSAGLLVAFRCLPRFARKVDARFKGESASRTSQSTFSKISKSLVTAFTGQGIRSRRGKGGGV